MLTVRPAADADLERLIEIHTNAFPDPRGFDARRRNFTLNPLGALSDLRVVVDGDGAIVGHAFLFALDAWFGGRAAPVAGIASVGVAPEARGRGVAAWLLAQLHAEASARGAAVAILFAFRQSFYGRHGYAPVTPTRRLAVHPASIPAGWRASPPYRARLAGGADREAIQHAYARAAARTTGWIDRPQALWSSLFQDERRVWIVVERDGGEAGIVGYVSWSLAQAEAHASTRLTVHEIAADDDRARRALLAVVAAQRDQVAEVAIEVDARDPLDRALLDADRARFGTAAVEHAIGAVVGGPMVRLLDVRRAIEARGYARDGAIDLAVDGERLRVEVRGGTARVREGAASSSASASSPPLAMDRATLAAILYGALAPSDAARLGWLDAAASPSPPPPRALDEADALFALPPYFALDPF